MEKTIQLQVRKDLNGQQQSSVIKLKGNLITRGYTEIIHISDKDENYHINFFETAAENRKAALDYITVFIAKENLCDTLILCS